MIETIPAVTQMSCDYCQDVREADGRPFVSLTLAGYADSAELAMVQVDKDGQEIPGTSISRGDALHFCSPTCAGEYVKKWAQSVMNIKQD